MEHLPIYVIRHIPTGWFLPEPTGRQGRGSSFKHPTDPKVKQPRFFYSELSAKRALSSWLQGEHHPIKDTEYDDYSGNHYTICVGTQIIKQEDRIKSDMEIVPITWKVI